MDNLRALATLAVIVAHVAYHLLGKFDKSPGTLKTWWIGNIYDSSARFAVPVFLMITGTLLLGKNIPLGVFIKKRFVRLLSPFLFWSIIYLLYTNNYSSSQTFGETVHWIFDRLVNGVSPHLWYMYMLIGIYLVIPIINKWILNSTKQEIMFFLAIWALTIIKNIKPLSGLSTKIDLSYFSGYLGYVILGYYLSGIQIKESQAVKIGLCLLAGGTLTTIVGTYYVSLQAGDSDSFYYNLLSPNIVVAGIGMFLLFKNMKMGTGGLFSKITRIVSQYSYGIYLIHILVLGSLDYFKINGFLFNPIIGVPLTSIICLAISLLIVWVISKLPYGKYIAG